MFAAASAAQTVIVRPDVPPGLSVIAGADARLVIDPPEIRDGSAEGTVPGPVHPSWEHWTMWPAKPRAGTMPALALSPRNDERATLILGGLFRAILRETVRVVEADGARAFEMDRDYRFNGDWGQIANLEGRLGVPGQGQLRVEFRYATQRLDLVQADRDGRVTIKRGAPSMVCPALPAPDPGAVPVAGIYVAPWRRDGDFVITAEDILPIDPAPPVAPVRPEALARARSKLAAGGEFKVAFMGDSITLGAEAGAWWNDLWTDRNMSYASRVVVGLRKRHPKAVVTPIAAFKGGITTQKGAELFDEIVAGSGADLIVIAFGLNDADGPIGGPPKNPPEAYKEQIRAILRKARAAGMEALLVVPMQPNPFLKNGIAERIPAYRAALLALADEENAGVADVYTEWMNQGRRGIPPFSQLHNGINHPGESGHGLYADVLLRFF
jgi:lysophospholipase L1-like esterase